MQEEILPSLFLISSSTIENMIIYQYFSALLLKRDLKISKKILIVFIGLILLYLSTEFFISPFFRIVITCFVLLSYSALFESKLSVKVLLIVGYISLGAIAEEIAHNFISLFPQTIFYAPCVKKFLSILIASVLLIIFVHALSHLIFNFQKIMYFETKIYYLLTPLFSIILSLIFFFDLNDEKFKILSLILLNGINICFFIMIKSIAVSYETKNKLAQRELELKYQRTIAKKNVTQFKEVRSKTHDINKYLVLIKGLIINNDLSGAIGRIDDFIRVVNSSMAKINTNHIAIDSMIKYGCDLAAKNGIDIELSLDIQNRNFNIEDIDVSVLLGNLIDNAIEATVKLDQHSPKKIKLAILTNHKHLFIQISNPVSSSANLEKTTKQRNEFHGFGIASIKQIVEKYNGALNIESTDNYFIAKVVLIYK
ncbi:GHKL domain-containing protein [Enterococcus casseliflavus]